MPADPEIDKQLNQYGFGGAAPSASKDGGGEGGGSGGFTDTLHSINKAIDAGPIVERIANVGIGAAEMIPGFEGTRVDKGLRSFFNPQRDYDPDPYGIKGGLGEMAMFGMGGPLKSLGVASRLSPLARQAAFKVGPQVVQNPLTGRIMRNPSALAQIAHATARQGPMLVERAGIGALSGAAQSPDDRKTGAVVGALGGLAPPLANLAAQTRLGQSLISRALLHGGLSGLLSVMHLHGLSFLVPSHGFLYFSPEGRRLHRQMIDIVDRTGRRLARVPESVARSTSGLLGGAAGRIWQNGPPSFGGDDTPAAPAAPAAGPAAVAAGDAWLQPDRTRPETYPPDNDNEESESAAAEAE